MRISVFIITLFCWAILPCHAQDPGADQDAEAAREKLLKAADQLDNIQANSESTKASVEGMKADVAKLQTDVTALQSDNATLKQQVADLQTALAQAEAQRVKERQILLDEVAKMVAAGRGPGTKSSAKKKTEAASTTESAPSVPAKPDADGSAPPSNLAPPPDTPAPSAAPPTADATTAPDDSPPPPPKPQKGYYHIVESGETLTMICAAYRDNGINVTVSQIKKANGLTDATMLKVGQKLFIPKPGN